MTFGKTHVDAQNNKYVPLIFNCFSLLAHYFKVVVYQEISATGHEKYCLWIKFSGKENIYE